MKYAQDPRPQLEFKVLRLQTPLNIFSYFPLHGSYNDIYNIEDFQTFPLQNKEFNFNITNHQIPGILNMLGINNIFGDVVEGEYFSALLIVYNKHPNQHARLSMPKIFKKINNNETAVNYMRLPFDDKNPQNEINEQNVAPGKFEIFKINEPINKHLKYTFSIYVPAISFEPAKKGIKEKINSKSITHSKGFNFESLEPFSIKEKFYNNQMKQWYIEIKIENTSKTRLIIKHIEVFPELKKTLAINTVTSKQGQNILINNEEAFNFILSTDNSNGFLNSLSFIVNIYWSTMFHSSNKVFSKKIKNEHFNIDNNYFSLKVIEQPNIVQMNSIFQIGFEIVNKTSGNLKLNVEVEKQNEIKIIDERLIEIIDIIDNKITLDKNENRTKTFYLMCKATIIGNICLPLIAIKIGSQIIFNYNKLLNFNCIKEEELMIE